MQPRSIRVGADGLQHSSLREQLHPLHNLSYAQNVGYALPGFSTTAASSDSLGQDSILKGWHLLSSSAVTSLNVPNGNAPAPAPTPPNLVHTSSALHHAAVPAFPGVNYRSSSAAASASTAAAAAASAAAFAAANRAQKQSMHAVSLDGSMQTRLPPTAPQPTALPTVSHVPPQPQAERLGALVQAAEQLPQHHSAHQVSSSRSNTSRAAAIAHPTPKPWADFIAGGEVGAAAAAAASAQLQNTLAASLQSNIRRTLPSSHQAISDGGSAAGDRVRQSLLLCAWVDDQHVCNCVRCFRHRSWRSSCN
jgi:hypothetical protein